MKLIFHPDCHVTDPPSTSFIAYPESESDLRFMTELVDLPVASRCPANLIDRKESMVTGRVLVTSLRQHLEDPIGDDEYRRNVIRVCESREIVEQDAIAKAFWIRMFHI